MSKSKRRTRKTAPPSSPVVDAAVQESFELPKAPQADEDKSNGDADWLAQPVAIEPVLTPNPLFGTLTPRTLIDAITLEVALYVLIFCAALWTRFIGLGARPLAAHEAASALSAWQFLQGAATGVSGSPLLFSANLLLFMLAGATDTAARFAPALVGSAVVLLPALVRREIGRAGALLASLILLFSTSLVFFARDLNGVEISTATGIAAIIWLWQYAQDDKSRDLYLGACAAAIALTASAASFTILLAGSLFAVISVWLSSRSVEKAGAATDGDGALDTQAAPSSQIRRALRNALLLFAAVYIGLSTTLLMNREGLGAAFSLLGEWLGMFQQLGALTTPLNLLLIYEPLTLVFGFAGLLLVPSLTREEMSLHGSLVLFGVTSVVALVVYSLAGVKSAGNTVVLVIPLSVLAGWFIGNLIERAIEELGRQGGWRLMMWGELPILAMSLVVAALVFLQLASFLQRNTFSPGVEAFHQLFAPGAPTAFEPAALLLGLITLVIVVFLALLSIGTIGAARTANLGALVVAILLGLSGVRALWLANFSDSDTVHEFIAEEQTSLQARDLVQDLEWTSGWRAGDEHVVALRADAGLGPVIRWYLRGFPNVQWVSRPQADSKIQALVTTADAPAPVGNWMSQRYDVQVNWQLVESSRAQLFKWLIYRDGGVETWQTVKLWVPQPQ